MKKIYLLWVVFAYILAGCNGNTATHGEHEHEAHEHEEKRSPYIAQRHFREYGGKGNEHERGARIGCDAIREACGENDEARKNGNDGVERRN